MSVEKALEAVRNGRIILIYDFDDREGESDMTVASQFVTHEKIRTMRKDAGGLLCTIFHCLLNVINIDIVTKHCWR